MTERPAQGAERHPIGGCHTGPHRSYAKRMLGTALIVAAVVAVAGGFGWLLVFLARDEKTDGESTGDFSVYP
ncbi:MAG TPA: hypothetical protein VFE70_04975 [Candidatus Elarobacter sp.]|nr:hypothetical protein [Candidatus Elarobacter sp.]